MTDLTNSFPVEFKITYWDDLDECEREAVGITFAESFTNAMDQIEKFYGIDLVSVTYLTLGEQSTIYTADDFTSTFAEALKEQLE